MFVKCLGNLILDIIALGLKFGLLVYSEIGMSLFNAFFIYPATATAFGLSKANYFRLSVEYTQSSFSLKGELHILSADTFKSNSEIIKFLFIIDYNINFFQFNIN